MALARDGLKRLILRSIGSCQYSSSASYLRTWKPTNNPCVAQARLATIRKDYKLQVSELRKQYYDELQAQKWEEDAKAQLQRKRIMAAKEKRKTAKKQQARLLAVQRQKHQTAFREMLLKEKAEKAKRQTDKLQLIERRRAREKELLRKKSSLWIDEKDLDRKIMEAFVDTTQL